MQIANDLTPTVRELSAKDRAFRAIDWATSRVAERSRLPPQQREARARYYDERAASYVNLSKVNPGLMEWAGLNVLAASILRAVD